MALIRCCIREKQESTDSKPGSSGSDDSKICGSDDGKICGSDDGKICGNAGEIVFSAVFMNSTCNFDDVKLVEKGQECSFYCEAQDYKENEVLVVNKRIWFDSQRSGEARYHDIYKSNEGFHDGIKESGRYQITEETEKIIGFRFSDASPADNGRYSCRTELNGETTDETEDTIEVIVEGQNIAVKFGRQRSEADPTIIEVYGDDQSIDFTTAEHREQLVMLIEYNNVVSDNFFCNLQLDDPNRSWTIWTVDVDTSGYALWDVLPSKASYVDRYDDFYLGSFEGNFVMQAVCRYQRLPLEHFSGRLNVNYRPILADNLSVRGMRHSKQKSGAHGFSDGKILTAVSFQP